MSILAMCRQEDCELKNGCLRFIGIPNPYSHPYIESPKDDCVDKSHELFIDAIGDDD